MQNYHGHWCRCRYIWFPKSNESSTLNSFNSKNIIPTSPNHSKTVCPIRSETLFTLFILSLATEKGNKVGIQRGQCDTKIKDGK